MEIVSADFFCLKYFNIFRMFLSMVSLGVTQLEVWTDY
jgi:hypothetical protein